MLLATAKARRGVPCASGVADTTALGEEVVAFEQAATATRRRRPARKPDDRVRLIWRDTSLECPNPRLAHRRRTRFPASPARPVAAPGMSTAGPGRAPADGVNRRSPRVNCGPGTLRHKRRRFRARPHDERGLAAMPMPTTVATVRSWRRTDPSQSGRLRRRPPARRSGGAAHRLERVRKTAVVVLVVPTTSPHSGRAQAGRDRRRPRSDAARPYGLLGALAGPMCPKRSTPGPAGGSRRTRGSRRCAGAGARDRHPRTNGPGTAACCSRAAGPDRRAGEFADLDASVYGSERGVTATGAAHRVRPWSATGSSRGRRSRPVPPRARVLGDLERVKAKLFRAGRRSNPTGKKKRVPWL